MNVSVTPCKGCNTRSLGCHGQCHAYTDWRSEFEEARRAKIAFDKANDVRTEAFYNRNKCKYPVMRRPGK